MYLNDTDFIGILVGGGIVCALIGWGLIEGVIWLSGFVHITFGGAS